ncbi:MAG: DUF4391 domain-containing protein [Pseudoflavonifractor sp.]|nr:DUF4391 domain-containing protein [Pseudoflavonifractor sp.]
MLGLPQSTEVKRPLPKAQLFKRFDWNPSQRDCFDADVARLDFTNWISSRTLPAITEGDEVKELFVIEVSLKKRDFDTKSIVLLAKSIPQRVIYALRFEDDVKLAVYHSKLFMTDWQLLTPNSSFLILEGLNLDAVWENIVSSIGQFSVEEDKSLSEQIKVDEEHAKLMRQIESLERQMKATKQPHRKRELFVELQKLKENI